MISLLPQIKALADETRLRLVHLLAEHELNVNELAGILQASQPRISRHLKIMTEAGLLVNRRDGLKMFYSLADSGPGRELASTVCGLMNGDEVLADDLHRAEAAIRRRTEPGRLFFDHHGHRWVELRDSLMDDLDAAALIRQALPPDGLVLDLGCGDGWLTPVLTERAEAVIGVDSSQAMLDLAQRRLADRHGAVSFRLGSLEHLPVADGEAEGAVFSLVLHHLAQPAVALGEARRALKPGGRLVVLDFDKHDEEGLRRDYGDVWLGFTDRELTDWLTKTGFTVISATNLPTKLGPALWLMAADRTEN